MATKVLMSILVFFIIPELLGMFILRFWKEQKNNVILAFVLGYIIEFAVAQIVSVPMILDDRTLTELVKIYSSIIIGLSALSFVINIWRIIDIFKAIFSSIRKMPILLTLLLFILIGLQLASLVIYTHTDSDDAVYVATATASVQTDTLYKYSAITGTDKPSEQSVMRYRLGPFPMYYAILSRVLDFHPAIVAHFILPLIFVPLVYMVYWLFAKKFCKDEKSAVLFMIFACILHIFSYYSGRNNFVLVLFRIWQGKAVLANIILPLILILFLYGEEENLKFPVTLSIFLTILAGCFTTTMSIAMAPAILLIVAFIYEIVKLIRKETKLINAILVAIKCVVCCIPSLIYGIMYFI